MRIPHNNLIKYSFKFIYKLQYNYLKIFPKGKLLSIEKFILEVLIHLKLSFNSLLMNLIIRLLNINKYPLFFFITGSHFNKNLSIDFFNPSGSQINYYFNLWTPILN